jgi:hypothetical protein
MTTLDLGNGYTLNTELSSSSYGIPVLVHPTGVTLGPDDILPEGTDELGWIDSLMTARQFVCGRSYPKLRNHPLVVQFVGN